MDNDPKRGSGTFASIFGAIPRTKTVRGEVYNAAVFQILSKDAFGRPKETRMIHEEESVNLTGGEEFMVGYVLKGFTVPKTQGKA